MITINNKDFNIPEIFEACHFEGFKTKRNYRFYGLKQEDNPAILIEHKKNINPKIFAPFIKFLTKNNISVKLDITDKGKSSIYLGFRHDLRMNDDLSVKLLKTFIYSVEGVLAGFNPDLKLKIPEFKDLAGFEPKNTENNIVIKPWIKKKEEKVINKQIKKPKDYSDYISAIDWKNWDMDPDF
jgi:hypothetical protein